MNIKLEPSPATPLNGSNISITNENQNRIAAAVAAAAAVVAYNQHEQQHLHNSAASIYNNKYLNNPSNGHFSSGVASSSHQHIISQLASSQQRNFGHLSGNSSGATNYGFSHKSIHRNHLSELAEYNQNKLNNYQSFLNKSNAKNSSSSNNNENEASNDEYYDETNEESPNEKSDSNTKAIVSNNKSNDSLVDDMGDVDEADDVAFNEPNDADNTFRNSNTNNNNDDDFNDNDNENLDDEFDDAG